MLESAPTTRVKHSSTGTTSAAANCATSSPTSTLADYVINSATPYELPVMRARLFSHFAQWTREYKDDPNRMDAYLRAERVHHLLKR